MEETLHIGGYGTYTFERDNPIEQYTIDGTTVDTYTDGNYHSTMNSVLTYALIRYGDETSAKNFYKSVNNNSEVNFDRYCKRLSFSGVTYYCFRLVQGYDINSAGEYIGNYTSMDSLDRWIIKSGLATLYSSGNNDGVVYRAIIADDIIMFDAEPEKVNFTDEEITNGTADRCKEKFRDLICNGIRIRIKVEFNKGEATESDIIENRAEIVGSDIINDHFRHYDEDYIKIINRNKSYTFTKNWEVKDDSYIADTVTLEVYNHNKEKIDTIELKKGENWTLTKEYDSDNIPVYVKEIAMKIGGTTKNLDGWDIYYSNTEGDFGVIKNNSISIKNTQQALTIKLTVQKQFETYGASVTIPKKVGFIVQYKEESSWVPTYTSGSNLNNYEVFYIPIVGDTGSITIDGLDATKEYAVQEVCIVDLNEQIINLNATLWSPSYSGTVKDQSGTITIVNKYGVNVSLQKSIHEVYSSGPNTKITYNRENRKATNSSVSNIYYDFRNNLIQGSSGNNKYDDVVLIEAGDFVTYKITAYNNLDIRTTDILITDNMPTTGATSYKIQSSDFNFDYNLNNYSATGSAVRIEDIVLEPKEQKSYYITIYYGTYLNNEEILENNAKVESESIRNLGEDTYRVEDSDYVKMHIYKVRLEKFVTAVVATSNSYDYNPATGEGYTGGGVGYGNIAGRENKPEYGAEGSWKRNNPVIVNSGDRVTYTIRIYNDSDVSVNVKGVVDNFVEGLSDGTEHLQVVDDLSGVQYKINAHNYIDRSFNLIVVAPQITLGTLMNTAKIQDDIIINKNNIQIQDITLGDNEDSDYIKLGNIKVSGFVWEDTSNNKGNITNGLFESENETLKEGIKVTLKNFDNDNVYNTTTNANGEYCFDNVEKSSNSNDVNGTLYRYIVTFEYDGVTYTNTNKGEINASNYMINSNAQENNRVEFNNKFVEIKDDGTYDLNGTKTGTIEYETINDENKAPMSIHRYNEELMKIESLTDEINLQNYDNNTKLYYLKYINLGLKGRDVFDLRINTQVDSANVKINGVIGTYQYDQKEGIQIRTDNDIVMTDDISDMTRDNQETLSERLQQVRRTDQSALEEIEVIYKVTVKNESQTLGRATKITDYFDKALEFKEAKYNNIIISEISQDNDNSDYNKVTINMPEEILEQSQRIDIYIKFNIVEEGLEAIRNISGDQAVVFYNLAEIESYKAEKGNAEEATRGLIDRDSAPGSGDNETVRLHSGSSDNTTVQYYFNKNELEKIKYEDDTSTAPTLVFTTSDDMRTLTGNVFEDDTRATDDDGDGISIRSGDGKLGKKYEPNSTADEEKIAGIKVELLDLSGNVIIVKDNAGNDVEYVETDSNGQFTFKGFLPGNYIIRYTYCGNEMTLNYNGQAYQSTNNSSFTERANQYWYLYNEKEDIKYSVANDDEDIREAVTLNWQELNNENTAIFQAIVNGEDISEELVAAGMTKQEFIDKNTMISKTNTMKIEVEKARLSDNNVTLSTPTNVEEYSIQDANFGIALRPKNSIDVSLSIRKLSLKATDGTQLVLAEYNEEEDELEKKKGRLVGPVIDETHPDGVIMAQTSTNFLHGAALEITYGITVSNMGESNYQDYINNVYNAGENEGSIEIIEVTGYIDDTLRCNTEIDANKEWRLEAAVGTSNKDNIVSKEGNAIRGEMKQLRNKSTNYVATQVLTNDETASFEYNGAAEISTLFSYNGRTPVRSIVANGPKENPESETAGVLYLAQEYQEPDTAISTLIAITPPTGENRNYIEIITVAIASLAVITLGIIGIKKFFKK